jgi:hypothetical protein
MPFLMEDSNKRTGCEPFKSTQREDIYNEPIFDLSGYGYFQQYRKYKYKNKEFFQFFINECKDDKWPEKVELLFDA